MRKLSVLIIIIFLICFSIYTKRAEKSFKVLNIYSASKIAIDLNKNNKTEENEIINIKLKQLQNLNEKEQFIYNYFTKEFAKNTLEFKRVKLSKNNDDLIINNKSYSELFNSSDFNYIKDKDYRILNINSNKYHYPDCKYAQLARNYIIIRKSQLPKDAKECNFCKIKEKPKEINIPSVYDLGSIKFFITDFSTKVKPDNNCSTPLCKAIIKELNNANSTIDMALYGYNNVEAFTKALKDAIKRGVKIRLVYDLDSKNSNYYKDTKFLSNLIKNSTNDSYDKSTAGQLMHNKFIIIDKKITITGSANISPSDMSGYNSNSVIIINSNKIASIYTTEFEQMLNNRFHNNKNKIQKPEKIILKDSIISVFFSPKDETIIKKVIPLINSSKKSIEMPTFLITHKGLSQSLLEAQKRGVKVRIIVDAANANNKYSQHEFLRKNGIEVKTENFAGKMHAKTIIIDDRYLIIGSMNFSKSGEYKNDENALIIENPNLARYYKLYFEKLWLKIPDKWLKFNAKAEGKDSIGSCSDGVDNNFDGNIDKADVRCK